jgi:hypothetical protein
MKLVYIFFFIFVSFYFKIGDLKGAAFYCDKNKSYLNCHGNKSGHVFKGILY